MSPRTYYEVLQVHSDAQPEVIQAAYRALVRKYHPDVNSSPDATRRMQEINEAYEILSNQELRESYDQTIRTTEGDSVPPQNRSGQSSQPPPSPPPRAPHSAPAIPVHCEKCGRSDATLRWARFRQVTSFVLFTRRQEWGGLLCRECRRAEARKAKMTTLLLGWWGIPFGILYTLEAVFDSSEGNIPVEPNADYLVGLGLHFLNLGDSSTARDALKASLALRHDRQLAAFMKELFGSASAEPEEVIRSSPPEAVDTQTSDEKLGRWGIAAGLVGILLLAMILGIPRLIGSDISSTAQPTLKPSATPSPAPHIPKPRPSPTWTIPTGWRAYSNTDIGFSALIQSSYKERVMEAQEDVPGHGIWFEPKTTSGYFVEPTIGVYSSPIPEGFARELYTLDAHLADFNSFLTDNGYVILQAPVATEVSDYDGCVALFEWPVKGEDMTWRGYWVQIIGDKSIYDIYVIHPSKEPMSQLTLEQQMKAFLENVRLD